MSSTFTFTFTRTHTATYVADHMRNVLRDIVRYVGLDPVDLLDDWNVVGKGARIWLESGHLLSITLEFYRPGASVALSRMDFPVRYDGSGADHDLWVDRIHLQRTLAKVDKLPSGCRYRVVLHTKPGYSHVDGFVATTLLSTEGLVRRGAGTIVATPDIVAGLAYWRRV